jgi:hypothetical protein
MPNPHGKTFFLTGDSPRVGSSSGLEAGGCEATTKFG